MKSANFHFYRIWIGIKIGPISTRNLETIRIKVYFLLILLIYFIVYLMTKLSVAMRNRIFEINLP